MQDGKEFFGVKYILQPGCIIILFPQLGCIGMVAILPSSFTFFYLMFSSFWQACLRQTSVFALPWWQRVLLMAPVCVLLWWGVAWALGGD